MVMFPQLESIVVFFFGEIKHAKPLPAFSPDVAEHFHRLMFYFPKSISRRRKHAHFDNRSLIFISFLFFQINLCPYRCFQLEVHEDTNFPSDNPGVLEQMHSCVANNVILSSGQQHKVLNIASNPISACRIIPTDVQLQRN